MSLGKTLLKPFCLVFENKNGNNHLLCKNHKKTLKSCRAVLYHFKNYHDLSEEQNETIHRISRLLK